jgi:hypothetical protein
VQLVNGASSASTSGTFTIAAGEVNTDVVKPVVIAGPTTGVWATDNTIGITMEVLLMGTGQANIFATNGNVFELFDVGLYEGAVAPSFQLSDYAAEYALCQRYWQFLGGNSAAALLIQGYGFAAGAVVSHSYPIKQMRATPTVAAVGSFTTGNVASVNLFADVNVIGVQVTATAAGSVSWYANTAGVRLTLNARM